jgi:hypothetical protein
MAYGTRTKQFSKGKQNWSIGETVKIGFVDGLEIIKKIATYAFQPHFGLTRCASLNEAMSAY